MSFRNNLPADTRDRGCAGAFEVLHIETERMLRQKYRSSKPHISFSDFREEYYYKVKEDALRLRQTK